MDPMLKMYAWMFTGMIIFGLLSLFVIWWFSITGLSAPIFTVTSALTGELLGGLYGLRKMRLDYEKNMKGIAVG